MPRLISTTVRLGEEDVRARSGEASRYYGGRRAPSTRLFESTYSKLGDESELFRDLEA
jgi:hypothetical protein